MSKYVLKLYVTGKTARSDMAINNLKEICDTTLEGEYELQVVDVLDAPEIAERDKILATPTLVRNLPPPIRRIVGDLSNKDKVLLGLDLKSVNNEK